MTDWILQSELNTKHQHYHQPMSSSLFRKITTAVLSILLCFFTGCTAIDHDETGIKLVDIGTNLPTGKIVALNGEKGPQADIYGPGWHMYNPISETIVSAKTIDIPIGFIGVIVALDGKPLPANLTFAPEWPSLDLLNARTFLESKDHGFKGPQATVLPPGRYRYNTALFSITPQKALTVNQGEVAVIKCNNGRVYTGNEAEFLNGVPLVPNGYSGIWKGVLHPGSYYIHPVAHSVITLKSTQRVYTYQKTEKYDDSIHVRSADGFPIAVDVRLVVTISPENAPRIVALHGDPDKVIKSVQENDSLEILELNAILPLVRTEARNIGERIHALDLISQRSAKERDLQTVLAKKLKDGFIDLVSVSLGNIDPTISDAGKKLIETQTDRQIADQQVQTFEQQRLAAVKRKELVKAETESKTEQPLVEAQRSIEINEQKGLALVKLAEAEQKAFSMTAAALGVENVAKLEIIRLAGERNVVITPQVFLGTDTTSALAGAIFAKGNNAPVSGKAQ